MVIRWLTLLVPHAAPSKLVSACSVGLGSGGVPAVPTACDYLTCDRQRYPIVRTSGEQSGGRSCEPTGERKP